MENMSDLIANLANNIIPPVPEPAVMETNHAGTRAASKPYQSPTFSTEDGKPVGNQDRRVVDNETIDDTASGPEVTENKGENFREVLEKRLSDKSESQIPSEEEKQPEKTAEKGQNAKNSGPEQKNPDSAHLADSANTDAQLAAKILAENGKLVANLAELTQAQSASGTDLNKDMPPHHIISSLPGKGASKTQIKAKGIAAGQTHLLSKAEAAEANSMKGQPVQSYPANAAKTKDGIVQTLNKDSGAASQKPTVKTDKPVVSNKEAGTEQLRAQLKVPDDSAKKPLSDIKHQLPEVENAAALSEKLKSEVNLPVAQKSAPTEDLNIAELSKKVDVTQLNAGERKQNPTAQTQKQAFSNNSKSSDQKTLDNAEAEASYTKAQNNAVIGDTGNTSRMTTEFNAVAVKTQSIQPNVGTQGPAPQGNTGAANNGSTNTVGTPDNLQASPSEQIIQSIRVNLHTPEQEIYIGLNPPELGRVRIAFRYSDGEITGLLETEKPQTKYDIEQSLPQIVASLQDCGVQVRRVDVVLKDQPQQDQSQSDTPDDFPGMEKQEFSGRTKDEGTSQSNSTPAADDNSVHQQSTKVTNEITDDTINVYV
jgi:flagellar hook-length control protein FliK